jgi:hypothetical protein
VGDVGIGIAIAIGRIRPQTVCQIEIRTGPKKERCRNHKPGLPRISRPSAGSIGSSARILLLHSPCQTKGSEGNLLQTGRILGLQPTDPAGTSRSKDDIVTARSSFLPCGCHFGPAWPRMAPSGGAANNKAEQPLKRATENTEMLLPRIHAKICELCGGLCCVIPAIVPPARLPFLRVCRDRVRRRAIQCRGRTETR